MKIFYKIGVLLVLVVGIMWVSKSMSTECQVIDLGTLGGLSSNATSINAQGQIVGTSDTTSGQQHAFLWQNGVMTDLGTLGGIQSSATAINNISQVIGIADDAKGKHHAYLWNKGKMTDLGTFGPKKTCPHKNQCAYPTAINTQGQVVGWSYPTASYPHAFLWEKGVMKDLGTLGGSYSQATFINEWSQVIGIAGIVGEAAHAFLWEKGVMKDLGTLPGGSGSSATYINELGQIVGTSDTTSGQQHAFLWQNGVMSDLGNLGGAFTESFANAVNQSGQVIGWSGPPGKNGHAFLWTNGAILDLGTLLDGLYSQAAAINNIGQVAGNSATAIDPNTPDNFFNTHAFIWKNGVMTDLGTLGGLNSGAVAMNSIGEIVGSSTLSGDIIEHAVLWVMCP